MEDDNQRKLPFDQPPQDGSRIIAQFGKPQTALPPPEIYLEFHNLFSNLTQMDLDETNKFIQKTINYTKDIGYRNVYVDSTRKDANYVWMELRPIIAKRFLPKRIREAPPTPPTNPNNNENTQ